jgi:cobalt-zinc-cadmium resistance protein CzcA
VLLVRSEGSIKTQDDLRAIVSSANGAQVVRLGDVAVVRDGSVTRYGVVTQGRPREAVQGLVLGLAGANAQKVVEGVTRKLEELKPTLPKGVEIKVFYNRAELVKKGCGHGVQGAVEATLLVLVLLGAFLGNVRAAVTVAHVAAVGAGNLHPDALAGMSANLMSLGGLAIALGMLVDAAVVVVENIVQHLGMTGSKGKLPRCTWCSARCARWLCRSPPAS